MSFDLALADNGDLIFAANRDLLGVSGTPQIEQRMKTRIKIPRASWVYDINQRIGSRVHRALRQTPDRAAIEIPIFVREALDDMEDISISDVQVGKAVSAPVDVLQRTNLCTNPSFEGGNRAGWDTSPGGSWWLNSGASMGVTTIAPLYGKYAGLVQTAGGTALQGLRFISLPVIAGKTYTFSANVFRNSGSTNYGIGLGNVDIGANNAVYNPLPSGWQRVSVSTLCTASGSMQAAIWISDTTVSNFQLDGVLIEESPTVGPYFDGDSPGGKWSGTPHNSISEFYTPYVPDPSERSIQVVIDYQVLTLPEGAGEPENESTDQMILSLPL